MISDGRSLTVMGAYRLPREPVREFFHLGRRPVSDAVRDHADEFLAGVRG
jgi:hypothetical protein